MYFNMDINYGLVGNVGYCGVIGCKLGYVEGLGILSEKSIRLIPSTLSPFNST